MSILLDKLNKQLALHENEIQLIDAESKVKLTGNEVRGAISLFRQQFINHKITQGDVVLIALGNTIWMTIIEQALWEIGAIAHPIAETTGVKEILGEFNDYRYSGAIISERLSRELGDQGILLEESFEIANDLVNFFSYTGKPLKHVATDAEKQLALILNTSGTTGKPKRVGITHEKILLATNAVTKSQNIQVTDHALIVMPMFHINAQIVSTVTSRINGCQVIVAPKFSASKFCSIVSEYQVTWLSVVPTIINILLKNEKSKDQYNKLKESVRLKYVRSASFSLPKQLLTDFEQRFNVRVQEGYGMTESTTVVSINPLDKPKIGSVGPVVDTDIAIYSDTYGVTYKANHHGEIILRGPRVLQQYLDPKENILIDGYFRTGDIGYFDEEGYLYVIGRIKEIINHGGEKVAPAKVESLISQFQFVTEVAVIGLPDELYGERVVAALHLDSSINYDYKIEEIKNKLSRELAKYEQPSEYLITGSFPRNQTGKVLRPQLIERLKGEKQHATIK
ncbi:AMP-binding protein [Leuconostoc suionicum]|uniref:AMP-binding protein n=1 Tax=Leuconostoc suionicum TaxID=1511761 RepID=UPI0028D8297A|nr:AMP-binding protein [Leuconostoc suionicum]